MLIASILCGLPQITGDQTELLVEVYWILD
jgi:hypothetical protein